MIDFQAIVSVAVRTPAQLPPAIPAADLAGPLSIHGSISGRPGCFLARGAGILEEL